MVERQTPVLIQQVINARAEEHEIQARLVEEEGHLRLEQEEIKIKAGETLRTHLQNPDTVRVPKIKPLSSARFSQLMKESDDEISRHSSLTRVEREKENYKFKVKFSFDNEPLDQVVDVVLASEYYPEGLTARSMRIDVSVLPHTFDIQTNNQTGRIDITAVSKKDEFRARYPESIGSPGEYIPAYSRRVTLPEAIQINELIDFINQGVKDSTIKQKDMTAKSAIIDVARHRQRQMDGEQQVTAK